MTEQALAETYLRMLNTHDEDLVDEFVAVDYINHNAVVADGREANRKFWTAFLMGVPDLTATMDDLVIVGDRVVGRFVYRGTHTGDLLGIPASGKQVEMRSIDIWHRRVRRACPAAGARPGRRRSADRGDGQRASIR